MSYDPPSDDDQPLDQAPQRATAASPETPPHLRKPSRQLRASLAEHAAREAKRKATRRAIGTPMRDDVARVSLHAMLRAINQLPDEESIKALRRYVLKLLVLMGFDEMQSALVLTDMLDRADIDRRAMLLKKKCERWVAGGCQGPAPYMKAAFRLSEVAERKWLAEERARHKAKDQDEPTE